MSGVDAGGTVVNLDRARKVRARATAQAQAAANRAAYGRTRGEKAADAAAADRVERSLDGARLSPPVPPFERR